MTETRTLQFESARALQSLYANDIKLLKNLEDSLGCASDDTRRLGENGRRAGANWIAPSASSISWRKRANAASTFRNMNSITRSIP